MLISHPQSTSEPELGGEARPDALSRRELALIAAFWIFFAAVTVVNRLLDPRRPLPTSVVWPADVAVALAQAATWALLTVPIIWLAGRSVAEREGRTTQAVLLVLGTVVAALVAGLVEDAVRDPVFPLPPWRRPREPMRRWLGIGGLQFLNNLVIAMGVLAAGVARAYSLRYRARREQAVRLQAQLAEARLEALRRQLDPHFLFNTLHAVSSLVERDPRGVRRMISRLSELLRYSMEGASEPEIPLRRELELLGRYVDIMQVRFQGRLEVLTEVDDRVLDALVPNLILQPLVENAIKHGVEKLTDDGRIRIEAAYEEGSVVLRVRDNGPGRPGEPDGDEAARRAGLGLRNTVARLEQLYGAAQRFSLRAAEGGGTVAEVRLPYRASGGGATMIVAGAAGGGRG